MAKWTTKGGKGPFSFASQASRKEDSPEALSDQEMSDSSHESLQGDDSEIESSEDEEEEEPSTGLDTLQGFIDGLPVNKRKLDEESDQPRPQKKRAIERTEMVPEGEFGAPATSQRIRAEDLISFMDAPGADLDALKGLKRSAKALSATSRHTQPLSAPLPLRIQDRLDRQAAYEKTKDEVETWTPSMKLVDKAEHLSFPLQAPEVSKPSTSELVGSFKPMNDMESAVDRLLKYAKLRDDDTSNDTTMADGLTAKDYTLEEIKARRAELRRARDLLNRAQVKAHRVAKIKSKTFRKIRRKGLAKDALQEGDLADLDPDLAAEERLRHETERAKERATLRHKSGSKWIRGAKNGFNETMDKKKGMETALRRGEELRRKIVGQPDSEDDGDDDDEQDVDQIKSDALRELSELARDDNAPEPPKGVFAMKFMQEAMARRSHQVDEEIDDFRKQLGGDEEGGSHDEEMAGNAEGSGVVSLNVGGNRGRFVYQPGKTQTRSFGPPSQADKAGSTANPREAVPSGAPSEKAPTCRGPSLTISDDEVQASGSSNPWLTVDSSSLKATRTAHKTTIDKNSRAEVKSSATRKKHLRASGSGPNGVEDDATVEISLDSTLAVTIEASSLITKSPKPKTQPTSQKPRVPKASSSAPQPTPPAQADPPLVASTVDETYEPSDEDEQPHPVSRNALRQRHLVAEAFAGDNVVELFQEEKARIERKDAPTETDTTLPGWGTWTGTGVKRRKKPDPRFLVKTPGIDPTQRKDFGKRHVIISEKKDAKLAKYQVKDLPFPYSSKAQYEKSLDVPLGTEWNTRVGYQKAITPRVVTKIGAVIEPLQKMI